MSLAYAGKAVVNVDAEVRKPAVSQYRNNIPDHEVLIVRFRTLLWVGSCLLCFLSGSVREHF